MSSGPAPVVGRQQVAGHSPPADSTRITDKIDRQKCHLILKPTRGSQDFE